MPFLDPDDKRRYDREYLAKRRADWFADKSCIRCGGTQDLRLDHIDPTKKVSHRIWSWSVLRREAELAKCQVLCYPCHLEKTVDGKENARGVQIGTAKLTEVQVTEARQLYEQGGLTFRDIGDRYGVHRDTIRYIVNRGGWKHLG